MFMDKEGTTLATEIFKELKASARRWFIAFCIMCGIEIATIIGFLWYISLPIDETVTTQEVDDVTSSNIIQRVGDDIGKSEADSTKKAESSAPAEEVTE